MYPRSEGEERTRARDGREFSRPLSRIRVVLVSGAAWLLQYDCGGIALCLCRCCVRASLGFVLRVCVMRFSCYWITARAVQTLTRVISEKR